MHARKDFLSDPDSKKRGRGSPRHRQGEEGDGGMREEGRETAPEGKRGEKRPLSWESSRAGFLTG